MSKFGFKRRVKSLFNLTGWVGLNSIKEHGSLIRSLFSNVMARPKASSEKMRTFDEAVEKFNLTEADLAAREKHFMQMSYIYGIILILGVSYWLYLGFAGKWSAFVMMFSFNFMIFSFFFRESFWLMQLKQRKLGMSFKDWLKRV